MSLRRKVLRRQGLLKKDSLRCCGERMLNKPGYDTEKEIFYTCPNCGKEKWVKRERSENA